MTVQSHQDSKRLLRLPSVLNKVPFSKTELYRRIRAGNFPASIRLGLRSVAWLESDIDEYIQKLTQSGDK
ncbi:AlpA family phage regulatory protein [Undibacterium jejuense]|uniref:AlpA family phage regulatory protein n=1 Tax=Undibacterium jejuense TaxID=1344949 RepID=A0A923HH08_9BURK|nr:AlpA family phage regulatory protein [Undibacterium jejuense]MBC3864352.1 AlpA family phage regulatory protein [Undibacterium jejuense]